jgi:hypothetical protein
VLPPLNQTQTLPKFQEPGVYYVQVFFDEKLIGERALFLYQTEASNSNGQVTA